MVGKPVIKGIRLSVEFILDFLGNGWTIENILENYPQLKKEDMIAVLKYAAEVLKEGKGVSFTMTKFLADENIPFKLLSS